MQRLPHPQGRGASAGLDQALEPDLAAQSSSREPVQAVPMGLLVLGLNHSLAAPWLAWGHLFWELAQGPATRWSWTRESLLARGPGLAWRLLLSAHQVAVPAGLLQEPPRQLAAQEGLAQAPASSQLAVRWERERAPAHWLQGALLQALQWALGQVPEERPAQQLVRAQVQSLPLQAAQVAPALAPLGGLAVPQGLERGPGQQWLPV